MKLHSELKKISMISSDLLFHYTRNLSTLKAILKSGELWPCYSAQYGWAGGDFAIPATCFCDIPKNQIKDHVAYYGSYGLGMSKQWAKDYKVSPVFYLDDAMQDILPRVALIKRNIVLFERSAYLFYHQQVARFYERVHTVAHVRINKPSLL